MFDPYHKWLGIPKGQRPPTYYQLLGIDLNESDPEVIGEAAIRQTSHVRTYQTGPQAQECTALLNEIAQARATLLHPARRKEYDARRTGTVPEKSPAPALPSTKLPEPSPSLTGPGPLPPAEAFDFDPLARSELPGSASPYLSPSRSRFWPDPLAIGYFLLLLGGAALGFWLAVSTSFTPPSQPVTRPATTRKAVPTKQQPTNIKGSGTLNSSTKDGK